MRKKKKIKYKDKVNKLENVIKTHTKSINIDNINMKKLKTIKDSLCNNGVIINKSKEDNIFDIDYDKFYVDWFNSKDIAKTKIFNLYPTNKQKEIFFKWFDAYIDMYNKVLEYIKAKRKTVNEQRLKDKKPLIKLNELDIDMSINSLRTHFKDYKTQLIKKTNINSHILDFAIHDCITMFKSIVSNINSGYIKYARLRYLKKSKTNKYFKIYTMHISKDGKSFCSRIIGKEIITNPKIDDLNEEIKKTAIIHYNNKTNKFTLHIKYPVEKTNNKSEGVISLDPGIRTFMTGISNKHVIEIGTDMRDKIQKELKIIDIIKSTEGMKNKRRKMLKHEEKIKNYVNDVHWKVINYLVKNYKFIILGKLSTKNVNECKGTNKMTKRIGTQMKMYQFRMRLGYKCYLNNCKLKVVNEWGSSKWCSNCAIKNNELGASKVFKCKHCNKTYDRDINGAKNILMKNIKEEQ